MKINQALISRLEHLARLELAPQEQAQLLDDLDAILTMVEKLQELDTTEVEPLVYINEDVNVLRADTVQGQVSREAALHHAPQQDDGHFQVPKVIDL
jgi:aspartyl-tRNA(Asn)/glutamyl-tRNA(Gln) amidotransferase subunit C